MWKPKQNAMSTYINPMTDFGFKYIFGREESKDFLIDFLNNLLKDEPGFDTIIDLQYLDKEKSRRRKRERGVIYDIHYQTTNGKRFTVEMQNSSQNYYIDRMVYYASKAIVDQGEVGSDWLYEFEPIYIISFMNFCLEQFKDEFRIDAALCDLRTHQPISDKQRYIFIQLPLFGKDKPEECSEKIDQWFYIFNNMSTMETMPFTQKDRLFRRLSSVASYANLSDEDKMDYDADLKAYRDIVGQLSYAEAKGIEKGIEKGIKKGREEEKTEMIVNMMKVGLPIDQIAVIANMTVDKVREMFGNQKIW